MKQCTTHHHACECREKRIKSALKEIAIVLLDVVQELYGVPTTSVFCKNPTKQRSRRKQTSHK